MTRIIHLMIPILFACLVFLSLNYFSCSQNEMPVFGEFSKSPLKTLTHTLTRLRMVSCGWESEKEIILP